MKAIQDLEELITTTLMSFAQIKARFYVHSMIIAQMVRDQSLYAGEEMEEMFGHPSVT